MLIVADGRIDFATFLDIMHLHSQKEKCQQEVMDAFKAHDKSRRGVVNGQDLYHILTQYGEKLDRQEGSLATNCTSICH